MRTAVLAVVCFLLAATFAWTADPLSDDAIYDQVRLKLSADRDVGAANIEVKVSGGVVELTGEVAREKIRTKAEKVARKVRGVQRVVNNLRVSAAG